MGCDRVRVAAGFQWLRRLIPQSEIVSQYLFDGGTLAPDILAWLGNTRASPFAHGAQVLTDGVASTEAGTPLEGIKRTQPAADGEIDSRGDRRCVVRRGRSGKLSLRFLA